MQEIQFMHLPIGFLHAGRRQSAIGKKILLADGTKLTLYAVTFGCDHTVKHGALSARMLQRVPGKWLPKWKWIRDHQTPTEIGQALFSEPHLVLWFVSSAPSNSVTGPTLARKFPSAIPPRPPRYPGFPANVFLSWKIILGTVLNMVGRFPVLLAKQASRHSFPCSLIRTHGARVNSQSNCLSQWHLAHLGQTPCSLASFAFALQSPAGSLLGHPNLCPLGRKTEEWCVF